MLSSESCALTFLVFLRFYIVVSDLTAQNTACAEPVPQQSTSRTKLGHAKNITDSRQRATQAS